MVAAPANAGGIHSVTFVNFVKFSDTVAPAFLE